MAEIEGLVRALREGDGAAKTAAARTLGGLAHRVVVGSTRAKVAIAEAGGIPPLVQLVRDGSAEAKLWAAWAMCNLAWSNANNQVLVVEAGGIPPLVELLRDGSANAKVAALGALGNLADFNPANKVLVVEAGGIAPLVKVLRDGGPDAGLQAAGALFYLAHNNDANAVAIAVAVGFGALVQLARRGRVTVHIPIVRNAGVPAKRKAALVVAALFRDSVPEFKSAPRDIKAVIGSYL